jgi:5-methylcytosine-specific restriction protein A
MRSRSDAERQRKREYENRRKPRALPTNSARWRAIREAKLKAEPLCRYCVAVGVTEPATELDHANGDHDDNRDDNLVPCCKRCNVRKASREGFNRGKRERISFDADGEPIGEHAWNDGP